MEYVKDAIEKARREREQDSGSSLDNASSAPGKSNPKIQDSKAIHVEYTDTRKECLSNRVLMDNRVVAAFENDERAEPYRQLRTQVLKKLSENSWRTIAITSAHRDAGKTLTAVNLAVALAKDVNQTVLLADMDLKGPNILDVFGISAEVGLVDHLTGEVPLQDIMVNPGIERLTVLPALPVSGTTSEILSSPRMKATLEELVGRYSDRLIVFDLPPLLGDDDALVFAPYVDATLVVVESGVTTPEDLNRCVQLLEGTNIIGTVLNKV
jgi:protein-tyrosine kinase